MSNSPNIYKFSALKYAFISICLLGSFLFFFALVIVLSLIPTYLPMRHASQPIFILSHPQAVLLRLSSNNTLSTGITLNSSTQIVVQNKIQAVSSAGVTSNIRVLNVTTAIFSQRKRRQTNLRANALFVVYQLIFQGACGIKCQAAMLNSVAAQLSNLVIDLGNYVSNNADDEVTSDIGLISQYWANIRPYVANDPSVFGVADTGLPDGCQVEQAHVLHRHGSRYPTSDQFDGGNIINFSNKIKGAQFTGPLSFLNTWTLRLGEDLLVPSGAAVEYQSGADFWNTYGRILYNAQPGQAYYNSTGQSKPLLRTTSITRNYESTLIWAAGFFGPLNTTDKYSLLQISADTGSNNTLYGSLACNHLYSNSVFTFNETALYGYLSAPLSGANTRFSAYTPSNMKLTYVDFFTMQSLCAYEYSALGSSDFCSLFTLNEWRAFEQSLNLAFYNTYGFGNGTGRAQGVGYVEELIARFNHQLINVSDSSVNTTLDSSVQTFPLDQLFYLDMSHDNNIASVLAALSIDYFKENLSQTFPPPVNQHYRVTRLTPFGARMITEKIGCISATPLSTNSTRTQYSSSQYGYSPTLATYKFVRIRLNNGIVPLDTIEGGACSVGRTDGLCPMQSFLASQSSASAKANFQYVCFANYTLDPNTVITDGVSFP